jgi:outer membrane lipoprotein SlyB
MRRQLFFVAVLAVSFLASCNKEQQAAGLRATVTMRDGTLVGGTVVSTSPTEIKLLGDDQVTRTLAMAQVKSIDYEDTSAAANAPAAAPADQSAQTPPSNAANTPPATSQPATRAVPESHEHPTESAITTKTYELPVGTLVSVRTEETIDSGKAAEGQTFAAEVTQSVRDESGATVIPRGANAQIIITSASKGGRFTKASDLSLDLKSVAIGGRQYRLSTVDIQQRGKAGLGANRRTAEYSGGGAALGAIIGAIAGGGKGAGIGAGAGAGAGAITQVVTKGGSIKVPVETVLTFKLDKPLRVVAAR